MPARCAARQLDSAPPGHAWRLPADQPDASSWSVPCAPTRARLERKVDKDLPSVLDALDSLGQGASFVLGHNVIDHDLPMLKRQPQLTLQQLLLSDLGGRIRPT